MKNFLVIAACALSITLANAQGRVGEQFSGVQLTELPGGLKLESRVSADGDRVRIETEIGTPPRPSGRIIVIRRDERLVYVIEVERRRAVRFPIGHPILMLLSDYVYVAYLYQGEIAGQKLNWEKMGDEQVANQTCEKHRVTGSSFATAFVYLDKQSRLPVLVELDSGGKGSNQNSVPTRATWTQVMQGGSSAQLFSVPSGFEVVDAPTDFR